MRLHSWCLACCGPPQPSCQSNHNVVDMMKDVQQLESLLEEKSAEVSQLFERIGGQERTTPRASLSQNRSHQVHMMTHNSSCIQKLRSKIAKEACITLPPLILQSVSVQSSNTWRRQLKRPKKKLKRLTSSSMKWLLQ